MANRNFYASAMTRSEQSGRYTPGKDAKGKGNRALRGIDGDKQGPVFEDPRAKKDRRQVDIEEGIPDSGCRRHSERRSDRINLGVWWMKRNYCVDLVAPRRPPAPKPIYNRGVGERNRQEKKA